MGVGQGSNTTATHGDEAMRGTASKVLVGCVAFAALGVSPRAGAGGAEAVVIDFDGIRGQVSESFAEGEPATVLVSDEFAELGVLFESAGGGIFVGAAARTTSQPNVVGATAPGPVISYSEAVEARFVTPEGDPAVTGSVRIALTDSSRTSTLEAYDCRGELVDSASGSGRRQLTVEAPGRIRRVVIRQGPMSFDDFTFEAVKKATECVGHFRRGDSNADRLVDVSDAVFVLGFLFLGSEAPVCARSADADDSGEIELTDAVYLLNFLFLGGDSPPVPGPLECGPDPTEDPLDCAAFPPCF